MTGGKNTTRMRKKLNSVLFTRDALRIELSDRKSVKSCKDCSFTNKLKKKNIYYVTLKGWLPLWKTRLV